MSSHLYSAGYLMAESATTQVSKPATAICHHRLTRGGNTTAITVCTAKQVAKYGDGDVRPPSVPISGFDSMKSGDAIVRRVRSQSAANAPATAICPIVSARVQPPHPPTKTKPKTKPLMEISLT